jgi:tape measure domain-containing protein
LFGRGMAVNLGHLLLSFGVDSSSYDRSLELAKAKAQSCGREIELAMAGLKLQLAPKVDDSALTKLNQHLDLKQRHVEQLQRSFDSKPLTPRVDTKELDRLEQKLGGMNQGTITVTLKADPGLISGISDAVTRGISRSSVKVEQSPIRSLLTGVFEGIGQQASVGVSRSFKRQSGRGVEDIGESVADYVGKRGRAQVDALARNVGGMSGIDELQKDVVAFGRTLDGFLDPEKMSVKTQRFEDLLVGILEDVALRHNPSAAVKRVQEEFTEEAAQVQEAAFRVGGGVMRVAAQPFRIRKRVMLAQSVEEAQRLAKEAQVDESQAARDAQSISLVTGGIDFDEGRNTDFAYNAVKSVLPNSHAVPVVNDWSNRKETLGALYQARTAAMGEGSGPMPVDRLLQVAIETGQNQDAIKMAAQAMAYRERFPEKQINLLGTSGGSYVVEEAIAILERAGVKNIKGAGIAAPFAGLTQTASDENFQAHVGDLDPLYLAMFGGKGVADPSSLAYRRSMEQLPIVRLPGLMQPSNVNAVSPGAGIGHAITPFLAEESFQRYLKDFLGEGIGNISSDFTGQGGIANLDFLRVKNDEKATLPRTLKAMFGDRQTIQQLEENDHTGRDGYAFFDPAKPEWRRDNDFKGMKNTANKKGKRTTGGTNAEFQEYMSFLGDMQAGLDFVYESGGQINSDAIKALYEGAKLYPELQALLSSVEASLAEMERLQNIDPSDVWNDLQDPRERQAETQRLGRLEKKFAVNPGETRQMLGALRSTDSARAEEMKSARAEAARREQELEQISKAQAEWVAAAIGTENAPKTLARNYEALTLGGQVDSLLTSGKLDPNIPLKYDESGEASGRQVLADFSSTYAQLSKTRPTVSGLSEEDRTAQARARASIDATYARLKGEVMRTSGAHESMTPDDVAGYFAHQAALPDYREGVRGVENGEGMAMFADFQAIQDEVAASIPDTGPYREKILGMLADVKAIAAELQETGTVSAETMTRAVDRLAPVEFEGSREKGTSTVRYQAQEAAKALGWDFSVARDIGVQTVAIYNAEGRPIHEVGSMDEANDLMRKESAKVKRLELQAEVAMQSRDLDGREYYLKQAMATKRGVPLQGWQTYEEPEGGHTGSKVDAMQGLYASPVDALLEASEMSPQRRMELAREREQRALELRPKNSEAGGVTSRAAGRLTRLAQDSGEAIRGAAESAIVAKVNTQLARTPGEPNTIDLAPRQVENLGELGIKDYGKMAWLGITDAVKPAQQLYSTLLGVEDTFMRISGLGWAKGLIQASAAVGLATQVPGAAGAFSAASEMATPLVSGGIEGALSFGGNAFMSGAGSVLQALPGSGAVAHALAPFANAAGPALAAGTGAVADATAAVATPVMLALGAGRVAKGTMDTVGQKLLPPPPGAEQRRLAAARRTEQAYDFVDAGIGQLQGYQTPQRMSLSAGYDGNTVDVYSGIVGAQRKAKEGLAIVRQTTQLASQQALVNPSEAGQLVELLGEDLAELVQTIDVAFQAMTPSERAQNTELAGIKGQLAKLKQSLSSIELERPQVAPAVQENDRFLQRSGPAPARYVVNASARIRELGNRFTQEAKTAGRMAFNSQEQQEAAQQLLNAATAAKLALDELLEEAGGKNAPKNVRKAVGAARGQITRASQRATDIRGNASGATVADDIVQGMSDGMSAKIEGVVDSAHAISEAFIGTLKEDFEIRSPSRVMQRIGHDIAGGLESGLEMLETLKEILPEYLGPVIDKAKEWGGDLIEGFKSGAGERMKGMAGIVTALTATFAGLSVISLAIPALMEFGTQALETAIQMERLERVINFSSGGAAQGGKALEFVRGEVKRLNTDLRSSIEGYAQLAANTKGTSLEGVATQQIFSGVSQANAAFSLSPEDSELVFLAINQMAQKSVVSMEELRQQLGERLPQTMKIAADSMGMTTVEFTKMVGEGRILAEDFLPKFGQELAAVTAGTAADAAESTQGKINALNTAVLDLQSTAGKGLIPLKNLQLDISTKALELVAKHMDTILALVNFLVFAVGVNLAMAWAKAGKAFLAYNGMSMIGGLNAMGAAIKANIGLIGAMAAKFGLLIVAQQSLGAASEALRGNTKEFQRMGKEAQIAADKASEAYAAATGKKKEETFEGPQTARDVQADNLILRGVDFLKRRSPIRAVANLPFMPDAVRDVTDRALSTSGERNTNDISLAVSKLIDATNQTLGESAAILESGSSAKLKGIDQQLATLQTQRRALVINDPQNEAGRDALIEQEGGLLEERKKLVDLISGNKGALKGQISVIESQMEALDARYAEGKIAGPDYEKQTARLESTKARITSFVEKLNAAGKVTSDTLSIMVMSLEDMTARIRDSIWAIDQAQIENETTIFEGQANGDYNSGQAESLRAIATQNASIEKLTQTMQLQQQIRGTLALTENSTALQAMGISANVGPNEITKLRGRYEDGSREGALLDQLGSLRELETETAEAERSIAEARASLSSQLREMGKQVAEFVRGVAQQIEDGQLAIKEAGLQAKSAGFQARIRGVLGINEGFIGEYVDGIFELFELIQEPIRQAIEATRQQQGLSRGLADSARAMAELQGQLPGGTMQGATVGVGMGFDAGGSAGGGSFASGLKTGPAGAIGAGTEYHLDTKFPRSMPMSEIVPLFDKMAAGYREAGRVIEFSSDGIGGMRYDETASAAEKAAMLKSAFDAHWRQDATRYSTDYYIPERSDPKGRYGQSAEGAEVILPQIAGGRVEFDKQAGGYGAYANLYDAGGNLKMQTGHGDMRQALPQDRTFAATQRAASAGPIAAGVGQGSLNLQQAMGLLQGGSNSFAAKAIGLPEGTRTAGGGWTNAGTVGHSDPGNRAANIGSFSAQGNLNRGSAEASDKAVIEQMLKPIVSEFMQTAQAKGVQVTPKLLMNYLDAHVQSPEAARTATSGTTFLNGLGMVKGRENDDAAILALRKAMYTSGGQTTIAGHSVEYNQNDRMQKLNKGMAAAGGVGGGAMAQAGGFSGLVAPTTGMNQASIAQMEANNQFAAAANAQLGGAQSALQANVQAQLTAAAELTAVQATLNAVQVEQKKRDIIRQGERTLTEENRTTVEQTRQVEDLRLGNGPETVERVNLRSEIEAARAYSDGLTQFEARIKSLTDQIESTEAGFAAMSQMQAEGTLPPQFAEPLAFLGEAIPKLKGELKQTQVNAEAFKDESNARITQVQEEGRARIEERDQKRRQQTEGVNREIQGAQIARLELFSPNDVDAIMDLRTEMEKLKISDQFMAQRAEMAELAKTDSELAATLLAKYEELGLVNLENVTEQMRKQREEMEASVEAAQRGARQAVTTSGNDILVAVADRRGAYGLDDDVVREQIAVSQQNMDHENRLAAIDDLERMGEASGYTSEQLAILRDNAEHLNQIKLEGIRDQFDPLIDVAKGFGEEMKGALKGLITGTKTAGEAFRDFIGGMASRLADLALNGLFNQIFGSMLGGLGGMGGGIGGGGIGSIIGGLIPGAKDGGMMMDGDFIFNYRTGKAMGPDGSQLKRPMLDAEIFRGTGGPIGDALNREGGQGTLAMINQHEMVLTPSQSQRLLRSGAANHVMHGVPNYMQGKLPNYMQNTNAPIPNYSGGRIPNYMQGYAMSNGGNGDVISVSIPVTLNGEGEDGKQKADRLSRGFRAAVLGVIAQEKGAGGQLYS